MPFTATPGAAEFVQTFATPGLTAINVWHVGHVDLSAWTPTQLTAMANVISTWEQATGRTFRTADVNCTKIVGRDIGTQFGSEVTIGGNSVGTQAGPMLPDNCTIAIKKDTGLSGRAFRGRVYHVSLSEAKVTLDKVDGTWVTSLVAAYNALLTAINAVANCKLVVIQTQINTLPVNPHTFTPVLSFVNTDLVVDSQRRRLLSHNVHR